MSRKRAGKAIVEEKKKEVSKEELAHYQQVHLVYLEQLGAVLPRFYGTPVVQGLTYELIQTINNVYLGDVL